MVTVGVYSSGGPTCLPILTALGRVFGVRCVERAFGDDAGVDAWVVQGTDLEALRRIMNCEKPSYVVVPDEERIACGNSGNIEFGRQTVIPRVLRGRVITADVASAMKGLSQRFGGMTVLASKGGAPVWAISGHREGLHFVTVPIPELKNGELLCHYFSERNFLNLLPLVGFIRNLTEAGWSSPPLQACFMIDDPNLHWRRYGFIDFAETAKHARSKNYHISFATIPLDTWFVHRKTAEIFQQHRDEMSLLIHGNNHVGQELARTSDEALGGTLRQALRRVSAFERRTSLEVAKVMAPPHGACSEKALREMSHLGFEAACISRGSLRRHNNGAAWLETIGMSPADIIGGLPVFPRFPFSGSCQNRILIAAFLDQPIIARGHHQDFSGGLEFLSTVASFINSFGPVKWADMRRISRSHYSQKTDGRNLTIRMFTNRVEALIPDGVDQVRAVRPWLKDREGEALFWKRLGDDSGWNVQPANEPIRVVAGRTLEICSEAPVSGTLGGTPTRGVGLWPVVRRQLTEARDRLAPMMPRISSTARPD